MTNRKLYVSIKEYAQRGSTVLPPQNFEDFVGRINRPGGFWRVCSLDKYTGDVLTENWCENGWTDNGVNAMWTTGISTANIIAIDQSIGMTTLTASIAAGGTVTSITVAAPTGPSIPSGTKLLINPGTSNTLSVTLTQAITTAGTVTVTSIPGPTSTIASGSFLRYDYTAVPTADPGTLSAPTSYTAALPGTQITRSTGGAFTGWGNRQLQITNNGAYLLSTAGSPAATAATYTAGWLVSTNPVATTAQTFLHCSFDAPLIIDSTHNGLVTIIEKL